MWSTVSLILPALIPSWRFFKSIQPSPRVQWARVGPDGTPGAWREFRPRPKTVSLLKMLRRLVWNPDWNESLFLVSCAERLQEHPTEHSVREIRTRIRRELAGDIPGGQLCFRLVFVRRDGAGLTEEVVFLSDPFPASGPS